MSNEKKTEDFTKSLRSSATLLLRTLDRLQYEYSETSARELSERVSLLAELDRLEDREAPIPMAYLRERVRLLQAYEKLNNDWSICDLKNRRTLRTDRPPKRIEGGGRCGNDGAANQGSHSGDPRYSCPSRTKGRTVGTGGTHRPCVGRNPRSRGRNGRSRLTVS